MAVVLIRKRTILGVWFKVTCRLCVIVKTVRASKKYMYEYGGISLLMFQMLFLKSSIFFGK